MRTNKYAIGRIFSEFCFSFDWINCGVNKRKQLLNEGKNAYVCTIYGTCNKEVPKFKG